MCKTLGFMHGAKDYFKHFFFSDATFPLKLGAVSNLSSVSIFDCPLHSTSVDRCKLQIYSSFDEDSNEETAAGVICALDETETCNEEYLQFDDSSEVRHHSFGKTAL